MNLFRPNAAPAHARKPAAGFTLIELLIVILLLGIMAAIVIPRLSNNSATAKETALRTSVKTIRSQIQMYRLQHGDQLPSLQGGSGSSFLPLLQKTTHGTPPQEFGPYLLSVPVNPVTGRSRVRNVAVLNAQGLPDPVPNTDYIYHYDGGRGTGLIWGTTNRATGVPLAQ